MGSMDGIDGWWRSQTGFDFLTLGRFLRLVVERRWSLWRGVRWLVEMAADQLGCKVHSEDSIVLFTPLKTNLLQFKTQIISNWIFIHFILKSYKNQSKTISNLNCFNLIKKIILKIVQIMKNLEKSSKSLRKSLKNP